MDKLTEKEKLVLQAYIEDEFCDSGVESTLWADVFRTISKPEGLTQEHDLECCPLLTRKAT